MKLPQDILSQYVMQIDPLKAHALQLNCGGFYQGSGRCFGSPRPITSNAVFGRHCDSVFLSGEQDFIVNAADIGSTLFLWVVYTFLFTIQCALGIMFKMICQTFMRSSLADEAVRLAGNLDPRRRSLLQKEMENAVVGLRKLHLRAIQRRAEEKYRANNLESLASKQKARVALNPELQRKRVSESNKRHRDKRNAYLRLWASKHRERRRLQIKQSAQRHPETRRKRLLIYRANNRDHIREYHRKYRPKWRAKQVATNPEFVLKDRMRSCLKRALTNQSLKKTARTEAMVGCTMEHLRKHIESQFLPGMSWSDPSSYSIDHIVPIDAFNLLDPEELHWSFNWQNLRPLPLLENKLKHAKIVFPLPSWLPAHIAERIKERSKCSSK